MHMCQKTEGTQKSSRAEIYDRFLEDNQLEEVEDQELVMALCLDLQMVSEMDLKKAMKKVLLKVRLF